jgi:hypothetical protein
MVCTEQYLKYDPNYSQNVSVFSGFRNRMVFKLRLEFSKLLFELVGFIWSKSRAPRIGAKTLTAVQTMFLNRDNPLNFEELHELYSEAAHLGRAGHMKESIASRIKILNEIYSHYDISSSDIEYFPPFLHPNWSEWFGHQSMIYALNFGQEFGILPPGQRYVTSNSFQLRDSINNSSKNLMDLVIRDNSKWLKKTPLKEFEILSDIKSINHLFENSEILRAKGNFIDIHSFFNLVCSRLMTSGLSLNFDSEYGHESRELLMRLFPNFANF